ncbi:MAG TPA: SDR family NAD(P)-dependent oxidoreductase, partial [Chloroflexota bacterium]|nr:SDR family NAD(P)-dependent oxidoreductase [Chloroflexota bacterium]
RTTGSIDMKEMRVTGEFDGKVAIVTGAAGGIMRVILTRFVEAGAWAVLVDINDDWGQSTADALTQRGFDVLYSKTDVRRSDQVNAMVDATVQRFGRVDILVHGAGVGVHNEIVDMSDEEWDLQIDVQLRGAFLLSRAVGRKLISQGEGGRIILIGSTSGNNARMKSGPHAASKAGEIQLSRVMALELGRYGITSNVVAPGLTDISGISLSSQNPEYQRAFVSQVPLGRLGQPDEIADAVLFIASDRARFITGQLLCVDGGYSAGKMAVQGPHVAAHYGMVDE